MRNASHLYSQRSHIQLVDVVELLALFKFVEVEEVDERAALGGRECGESE